LIRQAISCDICGAEMVSANHWFVAYDRGPELRIAPWTGENRSRAKARHLCGHKCLHKLVDDFMARTQNAPAVAATSSSQALCDRSAPHINPAMATPIRRGAPAVFASHLQSVSLPAQHFDAMDEHLLRSEKGRRDLRAEAWKRERQRAEEQSVSPRRSIA
jgi:hypothetical protein